MIDYLAQNLWQVWAVIAVLCLILEMTSGDCFIICFSFGAIVAAIAAAVGLNGYIQLVAFAVFTLVFLFWFRPLAKRYLHKGEDNRVSNADALLGRKGRVVETIRAGGFGRVQIRLESCLSRRRRYPAGYGSYRHRSCLYDHHRRG